MNIRYAILCERLRARVPEDRRWQRTPTTEEALLRVEVQLGFRLPEMLRTLYLVNGPGDLGICAPSKLGSADPGPTWTPELIAALKQHLGSYVVLGEDGVPSGSPEGFIRLVDDEPYVVLDGHTGYLFYEVADFQTGRLDLFTVRVSFCVSSVEDWLEWELDVTTGARGYYNPGGGKLSAIRPAPADRQLGPRPNLDLAAARREAHYETLRQREQALSYAGSDPRTTPLVRSSPTPFPLRNAAWKTEQARHDLLRQMYALVDVVEGRQEQMREEARAGVAVEEEELLAAVRPLIEADARLARLVDDINRGVTWV
jgi:hypothetical protein